MNTMNNTIPSFYDIPKGFANTLQIKNHALDLIRSGKFFTVNTNANIVLDARALRSNTLGMNQHDFEKRKENSVKNSEGEYFFPHLEMLREGIISKEEIEFAVKIFFAERSRVAFSQSKKTYADHIVEPYFLAWGLASKMYSDAELQEIRFDHGDEK